MATIRLQDVTKTYTSGSDLGGPGRRQRYSSGDRAFAERLVAQAEKEYLGRVARGQKVNALDHLNLVIPNGKTLAVVGPSGCGKSTLLRVIAGLTDYVGQIFYDDQDVKDIPPSDRNIGIVFQNYALYPHFYGKGNLQFNFLVRRAPDAEAEERIQVTSDMMGIGFRELLKRKPGTLSGGQQQRVAIGRAIVRNPQILLFDEPLSNLDAKLRMKTRVEIKRLLQRFQITTIYVTHDQTEAIALGDQIAVMRAGHIEQVGTYQEIHYNPVNAFVAGFLGIPPMNLLKGTVCGDKLQLGETSVRLPEAIAVQTEDGQALTMGIHAEAGHLIQGDPPQGEGIHLKGIVEVIEPDFSRNRQIVYARMDEQIFSATATLDIPLDIGYKVEVILSNNALYFFDTESEKRIHPDEL